MLRQFLLPILLLSALSAFSQTTEICVDAARGKRIADSLAVLPHVRQEANEWRASSSYYLARADSAQEADRRHKHALTVTTGQVSLQGVLLASSQAEVAIWKQRARRRGLINWLLGLAAAGIGYAAIR